MIISDSTTLIILFDLNKTTYLSNIFKKIYMPSAVYEEISVKSKIRLPKFMEVVKVKDSQLLSSLKNILDIGESEAIALAKSKNLPLIIDEKKGRKIAQNSNIKIIGLIGIIYLNVKKEYISKDEAVDFFDKALENGYRININLINKMMENL